MILKLVIINMNMLLSFLRLLRPSFFNYLVYGSADPIFQDLEKNKKKIFGFFSKFF